MAAELGISVPRYGVAGWPVSHSRSPVMHEAAYAALGIDATYQRLPVPPELFAETVTALPGSGFRGINVTIPHKRAAYDLAGDADEAATAIGAANTLTFERDGMRATNTDGPALAEAVASRCVPERALVMGAGGTARAAVWALTRAGAEVSVWNRTAEKAQQLAAAFGATALADLPAALADFPVVVNCTAVGMRADDAPLLSENQLRGVGLLIDFVYAQNRTPLIETALAAGCGVVEGPELLARQGALSFAQWFGVEPPLATMLAALEDTPS